jgi:hypothetical protein
MLLVDRPPNRGLPAEAAEGPVGASPADAQGAKGLAGGGGSAGNHQLSSPAADLGGRYAAERAAAARRGFPGADPPA